MESTSPRQRGAVGRPIVGLDVDGVVALEAPAAVATETWRVSAWGWWTRTITVPVGARDVIARLAEGADLVWISAWGHNAPTALREALDLGDVPGVFLPVQFAKADALRRYAGGRRWALIHDGTSAESDDDAVLVQVDPRRGLADVDPAAVLRALLSGQAHQQADGGSDGC